MTRKNGLIFSLLAVAWLLTSTGCAAVIAGVSPGVSYLPAIAPGSTRPEVRQVLGDPALSETRSDGTSVETYRIRRKVQSLWEGKSPRDLFFLTVLFGGAPDPRELVIFSPVYLIMEIYATGKVIYDIGTSKRFHVGCVYGPDDRLVISYDASTTPAARFAGARGFVDYLRWKEIENDGCPSWSACLNSYIDELRMRASWVDYTLPPKEEENFERLLAIARDRDEGRITQGEALIAIAGRNTTFATSPPLPQWRLAHALWDQLERDRCPSWIACVAAYEDETRRHARSADVPLPVSDEEFEKFREIAREKDEGRIIKEDAIEQMRATYQQGHREWRQQGSGKSQAPVPRRKAAKH